jgi:two-component system sensor histidine kinase KdpD
VGKPTHPAWRDRLRGSLLEALIRQSGDIDVYVVRAQAVDSGGRREGAPLPQAHSTWTDYLLAGGTIAAFTIGAHLLHPHLQPANLIMIYLLAVVAVALRSGRGPSILAAVLAVAAFDFFFVPPRLTFAVQDVEYIITFAVMLLVSLIIASLTFRLRQQAMSAVARERRTSSLYRLSRELASAGTVDEVLLAGERRLLELFPAQPALILRGAAGQLELAPRHYEVFNKPRNETAVMQWVLENGKPAGLGTATLPGSEAFYQPLSAGRGALGVLALKPRQEDISFLSQPEQRHLLDAVAALISIAAERELNEESEQGARLSAERERLRSTLLSSISHDLRTPLAGIRGSAETLLALGQEAQAERGLLEGIRTESQRLSLLLENILDLTRIDTGALQLKLESQPLEEVIGSALNSLERRLEGRELSLSLPADLPMVRIDAVLIERVLVNLLDNALKYTPASSALSIEARERGAWVDVHVADTGPGLDVANSEELFAAFSQKADSQRQAAGSRGAGLGLAICRAIVEAHGGTISARTQEGGGSVFSFSLPAAIELEGSLGSQQRASAAELRLTDGDHGHSGAGGG